MKTLKAFAMCAIMAVVAFAFSACNSNVPSGNPFVGEWVSLDETTTYTFNKDLTFTVDVVSGGVTATEKGQYFYTNTTITFADKDGNPAGSSYYTINGKRLLLANGQNELGEAVGGVIYEKQ